ncbi:hypothetical protein [Staphylococcus caledonicus]|uniref:hypothetical protein n=1 Tax=Staphylococcus caledonicus TaxID=2741333 RepID=UPI0018E49629|nr:hypothetical protein [Staphylococcus caledonicus]MBI5973905.1 hypothetical protein [Staphylococcus caledonicus]
MKRQERLAYSRQEKNRTIGKDIIKIGYKFSSFIGFLTGIVTLINALISFIQRTFL